MRMFAIERLIQGSVLGVGLALAAATVPAPAAGLDVVADVEVDIDLPDRCDQRCDCASGVLEAVPCVRDGVGCTCKDWCDAHQPPPLDLPSCVNRECDGNIPVPECKELRGAAKQLLFKKTKKLARGFDAFKLDCDFERADLLDADLERQEVRLSFRQDDEELYRLVLPAGSFSRDYSKKRIIWKLVDDGMCKADLRQVLDRVKGKIEGNNLDCPVDDHKPIKVKIEIDAFCFEADLACKVRGRTLRCRPDVD